MDNHLHQINIEVYNTCSLEISNFIIEAESKEYDACQFKLSGKNIVSRSAKITPKKVGQFVTFWKRTGKAPIEPFHENDLIDFFIVNVRTKNEFGQFVFPKSLLIKKGIISSQQHEGKRGFRVYPSWDHAKNNQAKQTQKWQLDYFYKINQTTDYTIVAELYKDV